MPKFPILVWYKIPRWKFFPSVKGYFLFCVNFVSFRTLQNSSNHASKLNLHVNIILILSKHRMDFLYSMNLFWNKWERLCTKAPNLAHFGTFLKGFPSAQAPCRDGQGLLWDCTEAWLFCLFVGCWSPGDSLLSIPPAKLHVRFHNLSNPTHNPCPRSLKE